MSRDRQRPLEPRNGNVLTSLMVARISGCSSQKEMSLEDQVDHGKEEVRDLYEGEVEYKVVSTKGKGERLDRPELVEIERLLRTGEYDLLVMEDVGRLVRGTDAVRLWGIAVDNGTRCIAPNDCLDTNDETWEEDLISALSVPVLYSMEDSMSHVVQIQTEVRDVEAIRLATRRLTLPEPTFGEVRLFSECKTGWAVQLPEWRYPVVADVTTGRIDFDNFGGRWGDQRSLDKFLQSYAVERVKLEARRAGHSVFENILADGAIKLTIQTRDFH